MMLRSQRTSVWAPDESLPVACSGTLIDPHVIADARGGLLLAVTALVPGVVIDSSWEKGPNGWRFELRLSEVDGASWATCTAVRGVPEHRVAQYGDRRLWDEVQAALMWWLRAGRPGNDRFGMSVGPDGQQIWLDRPGAVLGR